MNELCHAIVLNRWSNTMSDIRETKATSELDQVYINEFAKEKMRQGERFDDLYKILFNIELAALSIYVLLLRFFFANPVSELNIEFISATIIFWFIALAITVYGFFPKYYKNVMETVVKREAGQTRTHTGKYTILEYCDAVSVHKKRYILLALISFCLGLVFIIPTLIL